MSFKETLKQARKALAVRCTQLPSPCPPVTLFFSVCDGKARAQVVHGSGASLESAWQKGLLKLRAAMLKHRLEGKWLRVDWIDGVEEMTWASLRSHLRQTKRNYFRYGLALDPDLEVAFLEQELNANAMLYGGNKIAHAVVNEKNFLIYARRRYGERTRIDFSDDRPVFVFSTKGIFLDGSDRVHDISQAGLNTGRRHVDRLSSEGILSLIKSSSSFLARQVQKDGSFIYGYHPCFDRRIDAYNALRHASTTYAMIEAWEVTRDASLKAGIDRSLNYLTQQLIRTVKVADGTETAFLVDTGEEIKLGANAVAILALTKYSEIVGTQTYLPLLEKLALGISFMQDPETGAFVHVLNFPDLSIKERFRTIYYEGEAAFGLMRLYHLTRDQRWLAMVETGFEHFIASDHWKHHDHWLSYCVNELTRYRPEERYFRFGIRNVADYLDFILKRITTFPTLLELTMAAHEMLERIAAIPELHHLLAEIDLVKFKRALEFRAHYLLNGFFWPEMAMYFRSPARIAGSFFIRHHAFRVRIDDVEHYLSGYIAYRKYLLEQEGKPSLNATGAVTDVTARTELSPDPSESGPVVAWGGDVNLGRRQHYRAAELGYKNVLAVPALQTADLSIVNLECVVGTSGEQGINKGERSPYYYRARPEMLQVLRSAGVDVAATANNHSGDYGPEALLEQGHLFDALGMGHAGSGETLDAALRPVMRRAGPLNVALFSLDATQPHFAATDVSPGAAYLSLDDPGRWVDVLAPRISQAREFAHVILVAVHWGANLRTEPSAEEIKVGHAIIDAGADAVLGASAHLLQGIEVYRDRPILYDAGDLLFDAVRHSLKDSGVFRLELSANGVERVTFVPVGSGFGFSRQLTGTKAIAAGLRFTELCRPMGTELAVTRSGAGTLSLTPPVRPKPKLPSLSNPPYNLRAIENVHPEADARWQVKKIPEDARLDPVCFGPLKLLGLRAHPVKFTRRGLLWIESFWSSDAVIEEDIRIDIRAVPARASQMGLWGKAMDHDPCDWLAPTSRWVPGVIYRDYYGLRPPPPKECENVDLELTVGTISNKYPASPVRLPITIELAIPSLDRGAAAPVSVNYRTEFPESIHACEHGQTWTADQLSEITGGTWLVPPPEGWYARSVVRGGKHIKLVEPPVLYVASDYANFAAHEQFTARRRENWDTHKKLKKHVPNIAGAIISEPAHDAPKDLPLLKVEDSHKAIIEIGLAARQRFRNHVVAITGTAGKSTTTNMLKHMLDHILCDPHRSLATYDNYNTRVGAPALLASLSPDHVAAIVEIAQSALWMKRGPVTRLVKPTVALITEIGISQSDHRIKSVQDTAKWKSRIFDGLTDPAIAVVGNHLECFDQVMTQARRHAKQVVLYGRNGNTDLKILEETIGADESRLKLSVRDGVELDVLVPLPGRGMMNNAFGALAVMYAMGYDLRAAVSALESFTAEEGHLNRLELPVHDGGVVDIIDDSYNATVSSMLNAFSIFAALSPRAGGRKIAVLGRIVHLGDLAKSLHQSLAEPLIATGVDYVVTHGDEMQYLRGMLPQQRLGPHFQNAAALVEHLLTALRHGDLVLVKGSRRDSDFGETCRLLKDRVTPIAGMENA